jgi:ribbon-helix-helix CopG family protein
MAKRGRPKAIGATKEKVLSVRMESSAAAAIETISARFGVSSAYLIRQAINEFIQRNIGASQLILTAQNGASVAPAGQDRAEKQAAFDADLDKPVTTKRTKVKD